MKKTRRKPNSNPIVYLKESKREIKIIFILFILSTLIGFINANNLRGIDAVLKDLIKQASDLKGISLISFIFINNTLTSLVGMFLGIFLGIFPIITVLSNGVILGYVLQKTAVTIGPLQFWRLIPHGIFELPAVFISLGLGLKLGTDFIKNYFKKVKSRGMQILAVTSIILSLIGLGIIKIAFTPNIALNTAASLLIDILVLILIVPFLTLFFIADKKIRQFNINRIFQSLNIFIRIVIPLLIIAAIIEGLLITVL